MDSYIETGVAGLSNGNIHTYSIDGFGPKYRGTCLRPDVVLSAEGWPVCKTALTNEVDLIRDGEGNLRTGQARIERAPLPNEEKWPPSCAQRALRAARLPWGVKLISGANPIPDPARWRLQCRQAAPSFEMLIDQTGRVVCARVISVGSAPPAPGLYDSIRSHLMRWRFEPPTLYGEPVEVRWLMHLNALRPGDSAGPGPPISPVCP